MKHLIGVVAAMAVAACNAGADSICNTVPDLEADLGPAAMQALATNEPAWLERRAANCIHRWAYRLAPSNDDGLIVAKAVMQACEGAVNQHAMKYGELIADQYQKAYAPGVINVVERDQYAGQIRTEKLAQLEREAGFRVQQGRAGKCKA